MAARPKVAHISSLREHAARLGLPPSPRLLVDYNAVAYSWMQGIPRLLNLMPSSETYAIIAREATSFYTRLVSAGVRPEVSNTSSLTHSLARTHAQTNARAHALSQCISTFQFFKDSSDASAAKLNTIISRIEDQSISRRLNPPPRTSIFHPHPLPCFFCCLFVFSFPVVHFQSHGSCCR